LHALPDTRDNFAKQVAQFQLRHNPIGDVQKQSQLLVCTEAVHGKRNLIRNE
jgi:hypothetical protein